MIYLVSLLLAALVWLVLHLHKEIMMTQTELAQALNDLGAQLTKASAEITSKIADLDTAIQNGGDTTPEVDTALAALKVSGQALDDIVPDAPVVPTTPAA